MATTYHDRALTLALAVDLCSQWKHENGKNVIAVEDLIKIKDWINTSGSKFLKYPTMVSLAARGLDCLIAENHRAGSHSTSLLKI
ncbi:hypothetical protein SCT_0091 [Sulfuricella sp. T08]|uniref:hypothetical protein n=1 Tax=Sulfuricella sp. T08 TaxID=1632857 RepID=UPI0006179E50|nr:hypothetical protein [Sulfuricella sp. T08]GAO34711.1 hypothetical protein SCT_0091 [Sulfuricella sp. T08]